MLEPRASRPHMPGYGTLPAGEGTGLLPWSWALGRLRASHEYWVATVWPDGRPHQMPVWAIWRDEALWFSSSLGSRKIRNIEAGSAVSITTDDALNPVIVEGTARIVKDPAALRGFLDAMNTKYGTDYGPELTSPATNATVRVRPAWAFGLDERDFPGSPTRWDFNPPHR
ncbi:pyridoxamine 5'-phosphate oxidase family protein [Amycolatopsis sp. GM8]|uniref:pyridoxamine 5'-phosphate oxidase family protein n=1 Tax=Amycolatopsis sp. GM8 TaxID=2896530 RepID=UPI001F420E12|nr:pyridoxamine 5'-phosphate oxidase family protein [Amycolatopsis sp. GM8]